MKTPNKYVKNLEKGILTEKMLEDALYSVNKRAKNWRNKKREYKKYKFCDKYHNYEKAAEEEKKMYQKKEKLLSILSPICIHREYGGYERKRIYSYEKKYDILYAIHDFLGNIVWRNSYYSYETDCEIEFFDIEDKNFPIFRYYLFYMLGEKTFHTPITEAELGNYSLQIIDIDTLNTEGDEIEDLLSVQFTEKIISKIENNEIKFEYDKEKYKEKLKEKELEIGKEKRKILTNDVKQKWDRIQNIINEKIIYSFKLNDLNYEIPNDLKKELESKKYHNKKDFREIEKLKKEYKISRIEIELNQEIYEEIYNYFEKGNYNLDLFVEIIKEKYKDEFEKIKYHRFLIKYIDEYIKEKRKIFIKENKKRKKQRKKERQF